MLVELLLESLHIQIRIIIVQRELFKKGEKTESEAQFSSAEVMYLTLKKIHNYKIRNKVWKKAQIEYLSAFLSFRAIQHKSLTH